MPWPGGWRFAGSAGSEACLGSARPRPLPGSIPGHRIPQAPAVPHPHCPGPGPPPVGCRIHPAWGRSKWQYPGCNPWPCAWPPRQSPPAWAARSCCRAAESAEAQRSCHWPLPQGPYRYSFRMAFLYAPFRISYFQNPSGSTLRMNSLSEAISFASFRLPGSVSSPAVTLRSAV